MKIGNRELHVTKQTVLAFILFVFSIVLFKATFSMTTMALASIGPAFVPKLVSVMLFFLSVIELVSSLFRKKELSSDEAPTQGIKKYRDILSIVIIFFYILVLKKLGFILSSSLFLFFQIWLIQGSIPKRKLLKLVFLAMSISTVLYVLFVKGFSLILPVGILG